MADNYDQQRKPTGLRPWQATVWTGMRFSPWWRLLRRNRFDVAPLFERVLRFRKEAPAGEVPRAFPFWLAAVGGKHSTSTFDRSGDEGMPLTAGEQMALRDHIAHTIVRIAGELGLVMIQHSGHRGLWRDYRAADPRSLIPVLMQHPGTKFEVYHAGMPWQREAGMMAKAFPNVWLNLCWSHSLSRQMARSALDEWLDLVPASKIVAFGGDTFLWIEWVLGDLVQTRENLAAVLAKRIGEGLLTEEHALGLARMMLCDNPKRLYQLECQPSDDVAYQ